MQLARVQQVCKSLITLHDFLTLRFLLDFNSLRIQHLHVVRRKKHLIYKPYAVTYDLLLDVKRLPNCACCSISASNSPISAASRTLASTSATSASLASSIAFLPLANSSGLLP